MGKPKVSKGNVNAPRQDALSPPKRVAQLFALCVNDAELDNAAIRLAALQFCALLNQENIDAEYPGVSLLHSLMLRLTVAPHHKNLLNILYALVDDTDAEMWFRDSAADAAKKFKAPYLCLLNILINNDDNASLWAVLRKIFERSPTQYWKNEAEQFFSFIIIFLLPNSPNNSDYLKLLERIVLSGNVSENRWLQRTESDGKEVRPVSVVIEELQKSVRGTHAEISLFKILLNFACSSRPENWQSRLDLAAGALEPSLLNEFLELVLVHPVKKYIKMVSDLLSRAALEAVILVRARVRAQLRANAILDPLTAILDERAPMEKTLISPIGLFKINPREVKEARVLTTATLT